MTNEPTNPVKYLGNELEYLKKLLDLKSWSLSGGYWNQSLEKEFAGKFGTKFAVSFNSGTATLHAAMEALGVGPGDEVISPGFTVIMDSTATFHANAIPVYADIDPDTFNMDPKDIEKKITPKTKAILAVAMYGLPCDLDSIMELAEKHNLAVIEDNAQCYLSMYKGRLTGTIGHIASYSFENSKHLCCGEGGIIITDDEKAAEMARKIGGHGYKNLRAREGEVHLDLDEFQNPNYQRHDELGWNYRLSEFSAAIALAQLERLDELTELRLKSAEVFLEVMSECDYLIPQKVPQGVTHSYYTLGVKYEGEEAIGVPWADFRKEYINQGGDGIYGGWCVPYFEPVVSERKFVKRCPWVYEKIRYEKGLCPVAEAVQPKLMQYKTNYRDIELAKFKANALRKTIQKFKK